MKNEKIIKNIVMLMLMLAFPFAFSCRNEHKSDPEKEVITRDIEQIREDRKLVVVTDFNSINYFIYRGQPMGFQYDLLQELSDHLGIEIEVKVNNDLEQNFNALLHNEVDLIASNLTITQDRKEIMAFSEPITQTRQVLVQRKKSAQDNKSFNDDHVNSTLDLAGKTVYLQRNSVHVQRLNNLAEETGESFSLVEVPIETEQLIRMVSRGEIDFTVADEDVAQVNQSNYTNLNVETLLSFPQNQGWAMRKGSTQLKQEIDAWLKDFKETRRFAVYQYKYIKSKRNKSLDSEYYYPETGKISIYDDLLKSEAEKIDWDWRILASMIYQESRFNPNAISWAGAFGIMQLMPLTAQNFGVDINSSPQAHIKAGVRFIKWLDNQLDDYIEDREERVKFILASYNVGFGHVQDAMKLAEKYGRNPQIWEDNVEYFLLKKSEPEFYKDPVVRNGYARGIETYKYVREIMDRYHHYLNINDRIDLAQILK